MEGSDERSPNEWSAAEDAAIRAATTAAAGRGAAASSTSADAEEERSPNEWSAAEDAAIAAAMAAASASASEASASEAKGAASKPAAAAAKAADDADDGRSPNEWGAAEDAAIGAALAAAAAAEDSKPTAESGGDSDASPHSSLAENPAIEMLSSSSSDDDDDDDSDVGDDEPLQPIASSSPSSSCPPPPPRAQYEIETLSTEAQRETEDECSPFFVDLETLPAEQILHLRAVGLLPPEVEEYVDDEAERRRAEAAEKVTGKAAKVLGVGLEGDGGERSDRLPRRGKKRLDASTSVRLLRHRHASYLSRALTQPLSRGFVALDASRPWIVYWTLHSLDLLDELPCETVLINVVQTLETCWTDAGGLGGEGTVELDEEEVRGDEILWGYCSSSSSGGDGSGSSGKGGKVAVPAGGFGGGPGQMAHCAPSYAAVLALCIVYGAGVAAAEAEAAESGGDNLELPYSAQLASELLASKRDKLYAWYLSLRRPLPSLSCRDDSASSTTTTTMVGYRMHHDGEVDVRATYTMLAVTELLNITTPNITRGAALYVAACQTYEGGFGGEPHSEAHGGYTFCALAALRMMGRDALALADLDRLGGWLARRQMSYEGGFQGRSNKLVDGCYSFWQGGGTAVLDLCRADEEEDREGNGGLGSNSAEDDDLLSFDRAMLQRYILLCAQDVNGGLRDKPSKPRDFYHTCYNLSGLSVAQHSLLPSGSKAVLWGDGDRNEVGATHPVFNVREDRVEAALRAEFRRKGRRNDDEEGPSSP